MFVTALTSFNVLDAYNDCGFFDVGTEELGLIKFSDRPREKVPKVGKI